MNLTLSDYVTKQSCNIHLMTAIMSHMILKIPSEYDRLGQFIQKHLYKVSFLVAVIIMYTVFKSVIWYLKVKGLKQK